MAKEANEATQAHIPTPATITMDQLMPLLQAIASQQTSAAEVQAKILADALIESQKPYIDPKKEENEEKFRAQMRRQAEQERANLKAARNACPHIAGSNSLSEFQDQHNRTCIVWHQSPSSEWVGTCLNCQRQFFENDADYNEWRRKPSICKVSGSGQYQFLDPAAARARARGEVAA
jgi:metal-dependent amidase/aminoacylase/carboxypeptidase family protein